VETRTPRRRVGRAEREQQILDAAVEVFTERGFQNASMDAVAERVGVTKPVLYTHFGSKDGLLLACIARSRAELLEVTTAAVAAADTPENMMRSGIRAFFDYIDAQGPAWMIGYSEPMVAGAALESVRAQQTDFLATLLAARKPDADPQRLEAWAQIVVGACERLAIWRSTRTISAELATEYVMDLAWTGLSGGPPE
jgi:AcrR family transcriptional regulator